MKYSAGMMSVPYLFLETRITAELILNNGKTQAKDIVLKENLYQMKSAYRAERYYNAIYRRLENLPQELVEIIAKGNSADAKLLVLIGIMHSDILFFEFMYEAFRIELMMGSKTFEDVVLNQFFSEKASQSDIVAGWIDTTVNHLKQYYVRVLFETGFLSDVKKPRLIQKLWINEQIRQALNTANMQAYLYSLTGEQ